MKLYLPTTIATLMLLGVPSFSTAKTKTDEFRMIRGREAQNQYADEERNSPDMLRRLDHDSQNSPEFRRRILDHDSQPRLYYNNYDAEQSKSIHLPPPPQANLTFAMPFVTHGMDKLLNLTPHGL